MSALATEFGHEIHEDRLGTSWAAAVRNSHSEYAVSFDLWVKVEHQGERLETEWYSSTSMPLTLPGAEVKTGAQLLFDEALPADAEVEIEVIEVRWFVFDGESPPEPEGPVLRSRVDAVEAGESQTTLTVTVTNTAAHAIEMMTAIFYRFDGSLAGGSRVNFSGSVPRGESTLDLEFRGTFVALW